MADEENRVQNDRLKNLEDDFKGMRNDMNKNQINNERVNNMDKLFSDKLFALGQLVEVRFTSIHDKIEDISQTLDKLLTQSIIENGKELSKIENRLVKYEATQSFYVKMILFSFSLSLAALGLQNERVLGLITKLF